MTEIGIDFFVFDLYFNAEANDPGENLNFAFKRPKPRPTVTACSMPSCMCPAPPSGSSSGDDVAAKESMSRHPFNRLPFDPY